MNIKGEEVFISSIVGILAAAVVGTLGFLWLSGLDAEEMPARVLKVEPGIRTSYSCGTTDSPRTCTRVEYPTTFVVKGTDFKFTEKLERRLIEGRDTVVYRTNTDGLLRYTSDNPKGEDDYFFFGILALVAGVFGYILTSIRLKTL